MRSREGETVTAAVPQSEMHLYPQDPYLSVGSGVIRIHDASRDEHSHEVFRMNADGTIEGDIDEGIRVLQRIHAPNSLSPVDTRVWIGVLKAIKKAEAER